MTAVVTGGAGFIGSALVRALVGDGERVVTVDKLTYAGNLDNLASVIDHPNHVFICSDIGDRAAIAAAWFATIARTRFTISRRKAMSTGRSTRRRCLSRPMSSAP